MKKKTSVSALLAIPFLTLALTNGATAQTLTGSLTGTLPPTVDLTAQGTVDWLKFDYASGAPVITEKVGGSSLIYTNGSGVGSESQFTPFAGNSNTPADPKTAFSWSDGTSPTSGSGVFTGLQLESSYGSSNNGFNITAPSVLGVDQTLTLYFGGNDADHYQVSASLSDLGSTPYVTTYSGGYGDVPKVLTLDFSSATAGQTLTLNVKPLDNSYYAYNNVDIFAATLSQPAGVPEPSSAWLLAGGLGLIVLCVRRRACFGDTRN